MKKKENEMATLIINGTRHSGKRIDIAGNSITIDGVDVTLNGFAECKVVNIEVTSGNVQSISADGSIHCHGEVHGNASAGG